MTLQVIRRKTTTETQKINRSIDQNARNSSRKIGKEINRSVLILPSSNSATDLMHQVIQQYLVKILSSSTCIELINGTLPHGSDTQVIPKKPVEKPSKSRIKLNSFSVCHDSKN